MGVPCPDVDVVFLHPKKSPTEMGESFTVVVVVVVIELYTNVPILCTIEFARVANNGQAADVARRGADGNR